MKRFLAYILIVTISLSAQTLPPGSAALSDNPFALHYNPAGLGFHNGTEMYYGFPLDSAFKFTDEFSFYTNMNGLGFSYEWIKGETNFYQRYQLGLGFPVSSSLFGGFVYRWTGTVKTTPEWDLGFLFRPLKQISLGFNLKNCTSANDSDPLLLAGIGLRPLNDRLTLGFDLTTTLNKENQSKITWASSLSLEPLKGFMLTERYIPEDKALQLSIDVFIPRGGYTVTSTSMDNSTSGAAVFFSSTTQRHRTIFQPPAAKIVEIDMNFPIQDEPSPWTLKKIPPTVYQFVTELRKMKQDKSVKGIAIKFGNLSNAGFGKLEEIRNALLEFRASGKKIIAYASDLNNGTYFLASACDKVYLHPTGSLWLTGLSSVQMFFKAAFDKIGVEAQFERIGEFKSAVEPFTNETMSDSNRLMINAILDDINSHFVSAISSGRNMEKERVQQLIDEGPFIASGAMEKGLIDSLLYEDQFREQLKVIFGEKTKTVKWKKYNITPEYETSWNRGREAKIAIIYASGSIQTGKSRRNPFSGQTRSMGSATISKAIRKAREDKAVKAIVFRINSPGGSALASDIILREVELTVTGENRKPFIVSMSDVAGSGGYWIACLADSIIADPSTITGSIGVLGGKLNFRNTLQKLGINVETISRGKNALIFSQFQPFSDEERQKIREQIEWMYDKFLDNVSRGRGLSRDEVDMIGRGRIWTGSQGKERGLVDELGGIAEALVIAKASAGIAKNEPVNVEFLPGFFEMFFQLDLSAYILQKSISGTTIKELPSVNKILNYWLYNTDEYVHLMMPFSIEIQ